jgi:SufS family cysteine desulfurase
MTDTLRKEFPFLREQVNGYPIAYFDNAATTQKPQMMLDAMMHFYTTCNANVHRGIYTHAECATTHFEAARVTVADFINAHPTEIIFTSGTTHSINMIATCWALQQLKQGDQILITQLEHHANVLPWRQVAEKTGAELVVVPIESNGSLLLSAFESRITHKTKLISLIHTSHITGAQLPVHAIVAYAKKVGARTALDAAQSIAHEAIDVQSLGVDFLSFSAHKMGGPTGIGVLFATKSVHNQLVPYQWGGGMIDQIKDNQMIPRPVPYGLEAGTPAIAQAIGLAAAIRYVHNSDRAGAKKNQALLCAHLIKALHTMPRVHMVGPVNGQAHAGHIVSFWIEGIHAHDVAGYLDTYGIAVRAGNLCAQPAIDALGGQPLVRVSFWVYNTIEEVDRLVASIHRLLVDFS